MFIKFLFNSDCFYRIIYEVELFNLVWTSFRLRTEVKQTVTVLHSLFDYLNRIIFLEKLFKDLTSQMGPYCTRVHFILLNDRRKGTAIMNIKRDCQFFFWCITTINSERHWISNVLYKSIVLLKETLKQNKYCLIEWWLTLMSSVHCQGCQWLFGNSELILTGLVYPLNW